MTLADVASSYRAGMSCRQIAEASHRSETAVRELLPRLGVTLRPPGGSTMELPQHQSRLTVELYRKHGTTRTAEILGVAKTTVRSRLRRVGEPMPNQGRPPARPVPIGYETAGAAATRLAISHRAVRLRARAGHIPGAYLENGPRGRWLFPIPKDDR